MNICFVTETYPQDACGVADYVAIIASYLVGMGHMVHVITRCDANKERCIEKVEGVIVHKVLKSNFYIMELLDAIRNIEKIDIIDLQLAYSGASVFIHNPTFNIITIALRIFKYFNNKKTFKIILTVHEMQMFKGLKENIVLQLLRYMRELFTFKFLDGIIQVTSEYSYLIKKWTNCPTFCIANFSNIPSSQLTIDTLSKIRKENFQNVHLVISFFGTVTPLKNIERILEIIKKLNFIISTACIILGPVDVTYKKKLDKIIITQHLVDKVQFKGHLNKKIIAGYLKCSDISLYLFSEGVSPKNASMLASLRQGIHCFVMARNKALFDEYLRMYPETLHIVDMLCTDEELIYEIKLLYEKKGFFQRAPLSDDVKVHIEKRLMVYHQILNCVLNDDCKNERIFL